MNAFARAIAPLNRIGILLLLSALTCLGSVSRVDAADEPGSYENLIALFKEYWTIKTPPEASITRDYGVDAIEARKMALQEMLVQLDAMDMRDWPAPRQVDFLTVRAELNREQFILHVTRPWARDPFYYVAGLQPIAFTALPVEADERKKLRAALMAIPTFLANAKSRLTQVAGDYADLAIRSLTMSDGVEAGFPRREVPPAGVIGWYEDLHARAAAQPEFRPLIEDALAALEDFRIWLIENRDSMNAPNGVGQESLDWFVRNALLLPYSSAEMVSLAQREFDRLWAFYALERHRNRKLPELTLPASGEAYRDRLAVTDALVRKWLVEEEIISIPDYIPDDWQEMGYNVPWVERPTPPNFWEQVQYRDPAPDHLHAVIPGHRFDAMVASRIDNPIRRLVNFGARWQGWAVYLEEGPLQLGVLETRPRTRELMYIFGLWRAARTLGDIYNQWNEMTATETAEYWLESTPLLDPNVARKYAYLRPSPGHGLEYTIGNIEMFALLAARKRQLGDDFVLKEFHDEFISKGRIPMVLIQYEMTGDESVVEPFWESDPIETILSP